MCTCEIHQANRLSRTTRRTGVEPLRMCVIFAAAAKLNAMLVLSHENVLYVYHDHNGVHVNNYFCIKAHTYTRASIQHIGQLEQIAHCLHHTTHRCVGLEMPPIHCSIALRIMY